MTWCLNEYSDIFRCLLCWTVLPNVIFFLFTRAFQRIGSINCIYQQPSFQGGSVVFSHVQSEQRTNFGCLPPATQDVPSSPAASEAERNFPEKNMTFSTKGIGNFFAPSNRSLSYPTYPHPAGHVWSWWFWTPVSPRFRRGFRCHPVSQRAGVLRSRVIMHREPRLAAPFHWTKNMGKTSWETPLLCLECWVYFQYIQIYPKTVFGPGVFVDGNAFSNLWFRKVAEVLEGSGGICKVGVLEQIWFPPSRRQLL